MRYTNQEYQIIHRCGRCGKKAIFVSTRRFRVNANKNKLDVWLIYQCKKCRHTLNIPIFERVPPQKIPRELYEKFLENNGELAARYASDAAFLKSRQFVIDGM
jgi:hypothetical protein